ncbi:DUF6233 domain-containing protein [Streptomyces chartreusis]|uniref:DUF6233 domain-containing protein n=1 Tax=Streptomyces chartreusis TaxID=1969 RepID=UPI0033C46CBA
MNELPPDAPRLRLILEHLDREVEANQTIRTYLGFQRDAVLRALDGAPGEEVVETKPAAPSPAPRARKSRTSKPFQLGRVRTPDGPVPASVHMADCHMAGPLAQSVSAMEARTSLTDAGLEACAFCRPDLELDLAAD